MAKLFLLRHLKSQWNSDNRFAGWVDNPLGEEGRLEARLIAEKLVNVYDAKIDTIYTSPLMRNMETVVRIFEHLPAQAGIPQKYPLFFHLDGGRMQRWGNFEGNGNYIPAYVSESLNERYYGKLQGLNKKEIAQKYGENLVHLWRRGYKIRPPGGESLKDTYKRAVPFFKYYASRDLAAGKNVLLVASHNSLRAIVKFIEEISDKDIADVELLFGSFTDYEFDEKLNLTSPKISTKK